MKKTNQKITQVFAYPAILKKAYSPYDGSFAGFSGEMIGNFDIYEEGATKEAVVMGLCNKLKNVIQEKIALSEEIPIPVYPKNLSQFFSEGCEWRTIFAKVNLN